MIVLSKFFRKNFLIFIVNLLSNSSKKSLILNYDFLQWNLILVMMR